MIRPFTIYVLGVWMCCTPWARAQPVADMPARVGSLAEYVPIDTRLYFELTDTEVLSRTQAGTALGRVLGWLANEVSPRPQSALTQPAQDKTISKTADAWQAVVAKALGLKTDRAVDLLLAGPLAVVANDWQHVSSGILLVRPHEPAALESALASQRVPGPADATVRFYRLDHGHELACDGRVVIVGRRGSASGLYMRTTALLGSSRGLCLSDLAEFRERMAEVPPGAQGVLYFGTHARTVAGNSPAEGWWMLLGPPVRSAAVALTFDDNGLAVETTGHLRTMGGPVVPHDPPIESLLFLPESTLAAWTYPVPYVKQFDQFKRTYRKGVARLYLEMLEWQMEPNALRDRLLAHLVGDTVVVVGQVETGSLPERNSGDTVRIPTLALLVQTDDRAAVLETMQALARNIVRVTRLLPGSAGENVIHTEPISDEGDTIVSSIQLSPLFIAGPTRLLKEALHLSWCVADSHLIVATHPQTVREIVLARQGAIPLMPAEAVQQAMSRQHPPRRLPDMVMVAQPRAAGAMIDSWLSYIQRHYPEMFEPTWWQRLRRRYRATQAQLGIRPATGAAPGIVQVAETLPGWPADGRLTVGDQIVGVDGIPLDTDHALRSLRDRIALREREDQVVLKVVREAQRIDVPIPMPVSQSPTASVQPLALLKEIADLARTFDVASYVTWQPSRGLVQTRLDLRLPPPRLSPSVVNSATPDTPAD